MNGMMRSWTAFSSWISGQKFRFLGFWAKEINRAAGDERYGATHGGNFISPRWTGLLFSRAMGKISRTRHDREKGKEIRRQIQV